ncbi:MAG: hypothetical protein ACRDKW_00095 [Actinomycetota bacterium]
MGQRHTASSSCGSVWIASRTRNSLNDGPSSSCSLPPRLTMAATAGAEAATGWRLE